MEEQIDRLVQKTWQKYLQTPANQRLLIGIAGIPGSGKTTFSKVVSSRLNALALQTNPDAPPPVCFLPMDGFHLTRAELSAMPDPRRAHARRGAAFTFNAVKFRSLVQKLREVPSKVIMAPSFDHALKDPKEDDIEILPTHRIVVLEGNYVALDQDIWRDAGNLLDERWFVDVDFEVARKRLRERHVQAGIASTIEEGDKRAMENDLVNGKEIVDHKLAIDEVIVSKVDDKMVSA